MANFNKIIMIGNLTREPETRYTQGGRAICEFGLAVNRTYQGSDGQQKKETCFIDVNVWGAQAEPCGRYLYKGAPAFVEGRLQMDSWTDKDGAKKSKHRIIAERVQFLGAPKGSSPVQPPDEPGDSPDSPQQPSYGQHQKTSQNWQKAAPSRPPQNPQAASRRPDAPPPPPPPEPEFEPGKEEIFEPNENIDDDIPF